MDWSLAFQNPLWKLEPDENIQITLEFDGKKTFNSYGTAKLSDFIVVPMPTDSDLIRVFRVGVNLNVYLKGNKFSFRLDGTNRLLYSLSQCVTNNIQSTGPVKKSSEDLSFKSNLPFCAASSPIDTWDDCQGSMNISVPTKGIYFGEFRNGVRDGQGSFTMPNGSKYVGQFRNDKANGTGILTNIDGSSYSGEFINDSYEGQGTFKYSNSSQFVGTFKKSLPNGWGAFTGPNETYTGQFVDGKYEGNGTLLLANGEQYVGQFKRNLKEGIGTSTFPNGVKYVGEFNADKYNGRGILYAADGKVTKMGIWRDNNLVQQDNVNPSDAGSTEKVPDSISAKVEAPKSKSGTAFRVSEGQFVTNHHVIDGCIRLKIAGNSQAMVSAFDQMNDLALISVTGDRGEIASIRTTRALLNEGVTVAGFPLEGVFSGIAITNGSISRLSGVSGNTGQLQISAPVQPGNSGGPLLDKSGNVIGVISGKLDAMKVSDAIGDVPQNINFAISGNILRTFLDSKNISYKEIGTEPEIAGVQIASRASSFTYLVECNY